MKILRHGSAQVLRHGSAQVVRPSSPQEEAGFSLIEVMVAAGLAILVIGSSYFLINLGNVPSVPPVTEEGPSLGVPAPGFENVPEMIVNGEDDDSEPDSSIPESRAAGIVECMPEQREAAACIQVYQPVCASVNVVCITTPCPPVNETMSNSCIACMNPNVVSYTEGACES